MPLSLPHWARSTYRNINNMYVLPDGCLPNTPYLCFRRVTRQNGESEQRCTMLLDFWGPDDRWNSPQLGDGVYLGLAEIPGTGPWLLSRFNQPEFNQQCLVYVPDHTCSLRDPVERGFYIGFRDRESVWRLKLDSLQREKNFPEQRRTAQIYDEGALLWLYLPEKEKEEELHA